MVGTTLGATITRPYSWNTTISDCRSLRNAVDFVDTTFLGRVLTLATARFVRAYDAFQLLDAP